MRNVAAAVRGKWAQVVYLGSSGREVGVAICMLL